MHIQPQKLLFTDYLKKLPSTWVIEHFLKEDTATRKILSSAIIEESAEKFISSGELQHRFTALSDKDKVRCATMYLMGSFGLASESGLRDPLIQAFLGYAAKDSKGNIRLFGFDQFEPPLRTLLQEHLLHAGVQEHAHPPQPAFAHRSCNDMVITVALATQHLLTKKKNGKLGVTALQNIKKLTHTSDCTKSGTLELLADIITGYGKSRKLLIEHEQEFLACPPGLTAWLALPVEERLNDMLGFVDAAYGGWNRNLLAAACSEADEKQWLCTTLFREEDLDSAYDALLLLQFCQYIELNKSGSDLLFHCLPVPHTISSSSEHHPVIMPDFTVILPQECPSETLFTFARFCNMTALDRVYHALIEKNVLTESLSSGVESLQILSTLETWNAPSNVLETVREWIREFHRLSLTTGTILITAEEKVTEQIAACEQLQSFIEQVKVHSIFRIKPGCERAVREIVRKLGFDDRMPEPPADEYAPEEDPLLFSPPPSPWMLVAEDDETTGKTPAPPIRGTKYGAELKSLDLSETVQVIDYAILTGQRIVISYDGSPYVRKGMYTLTPSLCSKGVEPMLEGPLQQTGVRKQFYVKKIISIGVVPQ